MYGIWMSNLIRIEMSMRGKKRGHANKGARPRKGKNVKPAINQVRPERKNGEALRLEYVGAYLPSHCQRQ